MRRVLLRKLALKVRAACIGLVRYRIAAAESPVNSLNDFSRNPLCPDRVLDLVIRELLSERDPLFFRLLDHSKSVESAPLRVLLQLYGSEYRGIKMSVQDIEKGLVTLKTARWRTSPPNCLYFILSAIKNGDLSLVRKILDSFPFYPLSAMPIAHKSGVLRLAAMNGKDCFQEWRAEMMLNSLEQLQVQDLDSRAGLSSALSHTDFGPALRAVVPPTMKAELDRQILPFYSANTSQMRWMDCRVNAENLASFHDDIVTHLREEKPYSLIRLGDGESYAWNDKLSVEEAERREQVWWGSHIELPLRKKIAREMRNSISSANRLGVPSLFRFARDTHLSLGTYTKHISIAGLVHVLEGISELTPSPRLYTEERIHQLAFDLSFIGELSKHAKSVVIVSSLTEDTINSKLKMHISNEHVVAIETPTHSKTIGNEMFVKSELSLPYQYAEISAQVSKHSAPGVLILVACGSIGKIFCAAAQRKGGVALDIGAMIDYWVGLKTRSIADLS